MSYMHNCRLTVMHACVLSFFAIRPNLVFTWAIVCVFYLHSGNTVKNSVGHLSVQLSIGI